MKNKDIRGIIDRLEDDTAVILIGDEEKEVNIPISYLPSNISEGDVIEISLNVNKEETAKRAQKIKKFMERIFEED